MESELWPYRTKPRRDELFLSWLVRLSWGLGIKLQTLTSQVLSAGTSFLSVDVDRRVREGLIDILSLRTGVSAEDIRAMALSAYGLNLWTTEPGSGFFPWINTIARLKRRRFGYGQQFCVRCLREDQVPYFRRSWRLSFLVACPVHQCFLRDCCGTCGAPVEFHAGDFGRSLRFPSSCPIVHCGTCSADFRSLQNMPSRDVPQHLFDFQRKLLEALLRGHHTELPGAENYSNLFFSGLRMMAGTLVSRGQAGRLRERMLINAGEFDLQTPVTAKGPLFEGLRIGDRARVLELCASLVKDWPSCFVDSCQQSRVSSSYISSYENEPTPFWYHKIIRANLNDRHYKPSLIERQSAHDYLEKSVYPVRKNSLRRILGLSHTDPGRIIQPRWNPRGPMRVAETTYRRGGRRADFEGSTH